MKRVRLLFYNIYQVNTMQGNKVALMRRREKDIFKLRSSQYKLQQNQKDSTYLIQFCGPTGTPYQLGKWKINLYLPEDYPYKSPSVGFLNRIYHPNIDYASGSVCLDVINQTWTPMYELLNIFQIFLPQLLTYPNPASPLNQEAAQLFEEDPEKYNERVKQCILKHALNQQLVKSRKKSEAQEILRQQQEASKRKISIQKIQSEVPEAEQNNQQNDSSMIEQGSSLSERDSIADHDDLKHY